MTQKQKPSGLTYLESAALICALGLSVSICVSALIPLSHWFKGTLSSWWSYVGFAATMIAIFGGGLFTCIVIGKSKR